jgi:hypothetical protein
MQSSSHLMMLVLAFLLSFLLDMAQNKVSDMPSVYAVQQHQKDHHDLNDLRDGGQLDVASNSPQNPPYNEPYIAGCFHRF